VNIDELVRFHKQHGKIATMTAIQPSGRFGMLDINNGNSISSFREKLQQDSGWINGGFMVLEPAIFDYIENDSTVFEKEPLEKLAKEGQLMAYKHGGFWQCMDTMRDKMLLDTLLLENKAPWKVWKD
ncbi:MAG: glucose-1-phosphate cytidylyltransferase, partial [Christensenellaceae bacterium]